MYRIKANPSHWLIIRTVLRIFSPSQRSNESITWCLHLRIYNDPTVRPNSISKRFHGDSGPRITWHGRLASNGFTAAENIGISIRRFVFWFIRCPDFAISPSLAEACNDIYIYIQGCQVGQTKYRISDTMVADAASITAPFSPPPPLVGFLRKLTVLFRRATPLWKALSILA